MSRLVRLVLVALWAGLALGAELLWRTLHEGGLSHPLADAVGGWLAVAVTGVVLLSLMVFRFDVDPRARGVERMLAHSLRSIDLVTEPSPASSADQLLEDMLQRVARALSADAAVLYDLGELGTALTVRAAHGTDLPSLSETVPLGRGPVGRAASSGQPVTATELRRSDPAPGLEGMTSVLAAPLVVDGRLLGVAAVGTVGRRPFGPADLRLARLGADRLATVLERGRLYEGERRSRLAAEGARNQFALLAAAGEVLAPALDDYRPALEQLGEMLVPGWADWFAVELEERAGAAPVSRAWGARVGEADPRRSADWDALTRRVTSEGRGQLLFDGGHQPPVPVLAAHGLQSLMVVPVRVRGISLGVLAAATTSRRRGYRPGDVRTAEALTQRVGGAIERVLLYRETQEAEQAARANASRLRRLMDAALTVNRPLSERQVLATVADQARRVMEADRAVASTPRAAGEALRAFSPPDRHFDASEVEALLARSGRSARGGPDPGSPEPGASEPAASERDRGARRPAPQVRDQRGAPTSWLAAPLVHFQDGHFGTIVLAGARRGSFTPEDEAILVSMAQMASVAIGNARLYQQVEANSQRMQTLMESSPLAIVELDLDGRTRWWNRAASEVFTWPLPDSDGPPSPQEFPAELSRLWYRAVRGHATVGVEVALPRRDGSTSRQVSVSTAPMRAPDGTVTGIMAMVEDVTDRKVLEDQFHQAERLEAMGRLAGGVAHDFNNLVSVILGYCEMLLRTPQEEMVHESLEAIARAGRRAAALTSQLLAVGRREMGHPIVVDPSLLVREMEPMVTSVLGADIRPKLSVDRDPGRILIDPSQLERVILNLVINSRDAMPRGGQLTVAVRGTELEIDEVPSNSDPGRYVEISVSDTGQGMDPETVEHCFEPFFTTKDRTKGTGLGLAAVHGVVTGAGGHVLVESHVGRGTTFTLRLPAVGAGADLEELADERPPRPGTAHILLVEDEPELRDLARRTLESHGYRVTCAGTGQEALGLAEVTADLDLLLTDVIMPEMGGPELARRMGELYPALPVLFISGYLGDDKLHEGRLPAGADLLPKPFGPEELRRRVEDALERGEVLRERRGGRPAAAGGRQGSKR